MLVSDKSLILTSDSITFTFAASRSILMFSVIKASGVTGIVVFLGLCCLGGGLLGAEVNGITGAGNTGGAAVGAASGGVAGENAFAEGLRAEGMYFPFFHSRQGGIRSNTVRLQVCLVTTSVLLSRLDKSGCAWISVRLWITPGFL